MHKYIIQSVWGSPVDNSEASLRVFGNSTQKTQRRPAGADTDTYRYRLSDDEIVNTLNLLKGAVAQGK